MEKSLEISGEMCGTWRGVFFLEKNSLDLCTSGICVHVDARIMSTYYIHMHAFGDLTLKDLSYVF